MAQVFVKVSWLSPHNCVPPNYSTRPERLKELVADLKQGWNINRYPKLVGYELANGRVQLISGTHRWAACNELKHRMPVVVFPRDVVFECWGIPDKWKELMEMGNHA